MTTPPRLLRQRVAEIHHLIAAGQLERAGHACEHLASTFPDQPLAWQVFSELWLSCRHFDHALNCARKACSLAPGDTAAQGQLAKALAFTGQVEQAIGVADQVLGSDPKDPAALATVGGVFGMAGIHDRALTCFRAASELAPEHPGHLYNLATSLRLHGQDRKAEAAYDRLLALNPDDAEAWYSRSQLRRQTEDSNHVEVLRERIADGGDQRLLIHLNYALGKELDDLGRYPEAFDAIGKGARLQDSLLGYHPDDDIEAMDALARTFSEPAGRAGDKGSVGPIFVVGLPRTATTLVEQILGRHSRVSALGELPDFQLELLQRADIRPGSAQAMQAVVAGADRTDYASVGRRYLQRVRQRHGNPEIFVDKLPGNLAVLGPIERALPGARIIVLERDLMDTALAIYTTLFRFGYPYSYDLDKLARYLIAAHDLRQHWLDTLPESMIMPLRYEDLVSEPESQARRLLDHCGLNWEENCLAPTDSSQAVATPSAGQVRQPIYRSSVARWKNYATQLEGLRRQLVTAGVID